MSGGVDGLVTQVERTRAELSQALSDPDVASDRKRYADLTRRYAGLEEAAQLAVRWRDALGRATEARAMLAEGEDEDFRALLKEAEAEVDELEPLIRAAMVQPDPNDSRDVIVEIRSGTGGEEAALFARDLLDIYRRYAEARGFKVELLDVSAADAGGVKEATFAVKGDGAFSVFKHEGGVHRVQRVPATESQGRIHTSTATVAVLPEAEEVDVTIDQNDLKIDVYRSSAPAACTRNVTMPTTRQSLRSAILPPQVDKRSAGARYAMARAPTTTGLPVSSHTNHPAATACSQVPPLDATLASHTLRNDGMRSTKGMPMPTRSSYENGEGLPS